MSKTDKSHKVVINMSFSQPHVGMHFVSHKLQKICFQKVIDALVNVTDIIFCTLLALKYICYKYIHGTHSSETVNLGSLAENQDILK